MNCGFKIHRGYSRMTVWHFNKTKRLVMTTTVIPNKTFTRYEKYTELKKRLADAGIDAPVYSDVEKHS